MKDKLKYLPFFITLVLSATSFFLTFQFKITSAYTRTSTFLDIIEKSDNTINGSETITMISLLLLIIMVAVKNKYWAHLFALVAFLSTIHIFQIFLYTYSFGISKLKVELISLFIFLFHLYFNIHIMEDLKKRLNLQGRSDKELNNSRISGFESKFLSKSENELESIINSNRHSLEAREAAQNLKTKHATAQNQNNT